TLGRDPRFEVSVSCTDDARRVLRLFNVSLTGEIHARLAREGLKPTLEKKGFDFVITGDTVRDAAEYGPTILVYIGHGMPNLKTVIWRNLEEHAHQRYVVMIEGAYTKAILDRLKLPNALLVEGI